MATRSTKPTGSALFEFARKLLRIENPAAAARRAGVQSPTLYRWDKGEVVPDQLIILEKLLQAYGYGLEVVKLPPPEPEPFHLVVRDETTPPPAPGG